MLLKILIQMHQMLFIITITSRSNSELSSNKLYSEEQGDQIQYFQNKHQVSINKNMPLSP